MQVKQKCAVKLICRPMPLRNPNHNPKTYFHRLTSGSVHAKGLPRTISLQTLVLIASRLPFKAQIDSLTDEATDTAESHTHAGS